MKKKGEENKTKNICIRMVGFLESAKHVNAVFFHFRSLAFFFFFFLPCCYHLLVGAALKEISWWPACCEWVGTACLSLSAAVVSAVLNAVCVTDVRLCTWEMQTLVRQDLHNERTQTAAAAFLKTVMGLLLLACFFSSSSRKCSRGNTQSTFL